MPFELGIDLGIKIGGSEQMATKVLLVIANEKYDHQAALSDIAGWDVRAHKGSREQAVRHVRTWLVSHGFCVRSGSQIIGDFVGFQEWDFERLLSDGWDEEDIRSRGTGELLDAMRAWRDAGRPATHN